MGRAKRSLPTWAVIAVVAVILVLEYTDKGSAPDLSAPVNEETVRLRGVIDGDTLDVQTSGGATLRVRLLGIDCMETYQEEKMRKQAHRFQRSLRDIEDLGNEAKKHLTNLVKRGELTLIQPDGFPLKDPYGRSLAYLEVDGNDVCLSLLRAGLAETRREPHPRASVYQSAAREGRQAKTGIYKD